jgi:mRNA interferase HigB
VRRHFANARIISGDRVIFNIRGGNYRLVVRIDYQFRKVYVRFIGTHAEYDRINALEV